MKLCLSLCATLALIVSFATFRSYAGEQAGPPAADAAQVAKSVTVFPIVLRPEKPLPPGALPPEMSKNMAELVGLFLELGGMKDVEIADTEFSPPEKADLAQTAEAFGRFVQSKNIGTEYALFGQFAGMPGTGVDEIRLVAVDRHGKVLLSELRDKEQLATLGERVEPMIACDHVFSRLRGLWGLTEPIATGKREGKMAKLWAERSGLPPKSELDAIELRLNNLKKTLKTSTVAVFPVRVNGKSDSQLAVRLAEMLAKEDIGRAEASSLDPKLQIQGNTNQTRIVWDIARAFQAFLRKNPPAADYALMADYGIGRTMDGQTAAAGIQFVLCDRNGDWVVVDLQNSHHPVFQQINPKSPDDCNRVVAEALKERLR